MVQEGTDETSKVTPPKEIKVNFNVDNQPIEINLHDVNRLFTDMERYNNQFSLGSMMSRVIISHFEPEDSDEIKPQAGIVDEEGNQQVDAFFLMSAHKNLLDNIGLSLEPVSGKEAFIQNEEGSAGVGEMRANVNNNERFTSFLEALQPEQVSTSGTKSGLEKLSGILAKQVLDKYNLQFPEEEALQLFGSLDKIVAEYKRLGMSESVSRLETYLEHGKTGDLREYVATERKGLFSEPGHFFGPADWQTDSSPSMLESRWNEAIDILEMAKENPKAGELYDKLQTHLNMCVDIAIDNLKTLSYWEPDTREKLGTILEVAKQKLSQLTQSPRLSIVQYP